ncbi:MAG: hypothetical protein ACYTHJ_20210 [Planctomycetota bacterium]|jgi:hypothetical protein
MGKRPGNRPGGNDQRDSPSTALNARYAFTWTLIALTSATAVASHEGVYQRAGWFLDADFKVL